MESASSTKNKKITDDQLKELIDKAMGMREKAYCPYSKFRVGAALLTHNNRFYTGCNVENASYGLTVCAERVAIYSAVAGGDTEISAMAVCCDIKGKFQGPCGACRQVLVEFGEDMTFFCVKPDGTYQEMVVRDLMPMAFTPSSLAEAAD
ncbi:hypothetical protein EB796_007873 [Bugula neritina]|uniref:Cytidine deaminase n=1 Tax=Bugula neritina TaxID=10212 RepID=A0A7J7K8C5_BUGNE|nr:hypothetical protein EB796_007873 [Bugula neritina]